eukprot:gnl/Chilomastix_cuspidata/1576.p1 GENE.gnl/Chilomastix_cuspidata/1576~~gnl/Chilomastix_cuspidata/1576.p1  ORF type:complete len:1393 (-),score=354.02 gnl/Chilomastix_cuspidata/1576:13-3840(-)
MYAYVVVLLRQYPLAVLCLLRPYSLSISGARLSRLYHTFVLAFAVASVGFIGQTGDDRLCKLLALLCIGVAAVPPWAFRVMRAYSERALQELAVRAARHVLVLDRSLRAGVDRLPDPCMKFLIDSAPEETLFFQSAAVLFLKIRTTYSSKTITLKEFQKAIGAIDRLARRFHVEKVKHVNHLYLCVAGLDYFSYDTYDRRQTAIRVNKARIMSAVQNLLLFTNSVEAEFEALRYPFVVSAGLSVGPVVASALGFQRIDFDIWGCPVNHAARLVNSAGGGELLLASSTKPFLKFQGKRLTERRLPLKGIYEKKCISMPISKLALFYDLVRSKRTTSQGIVPRELFSYDDMSVRRITARRKLSMKENLIRYATEHSGGTTHADVLEKRVPLRDGSPDGAASASRVYAKRRSKSLPWFWNRTFTPACASLVPSIFDVISDKHASDVLLDGSTTLSSAFFRKSFRTTDTSNRYLQDVLLATAAPGRRGERQGIRKNSVIEALIANPIVQNVVEKTRDQFCPDGARSFQFPEGVTQTLPAQDILAFTALSHLNDSQVDRSSVVSGGYASWLRARAMELLGNARRWVFTWCSSLFGVASSSSLSLLVSTFAAEARESASRLFLIFVLSVLLLGLQLLATLLLFVRGLIGTTLMHVALAQAALFSVCALVRVLVCHAFLRLCDRRILGGTPRLLFWRVVVQLLRYSAYMVVLHGLMFFTTQTEAQSEAVRIGAGTDAQFLAAILLLLLFWINVQVFVFTELSECVTPPLQTKSCCVVFFVLTLARLVTSGAAWNSFHTVLTLRLLSILAQRFRVHIELGRLGQFYNNVWVSTLRMAQLLSGILHPTEFRALFGTSVEEPVGGDLLAYTPPCSASREGREFFSQFLGTFSKHWDTLPEPPEFPMVPLFASVAPPSDQQLRRFHALILSYLHKMSLEWNHLQLRAPVVPDEKRGEYTRHTVDFFVSHAPDSPEFFAQALRFSIDRCTPLGYYFSIYRKFRTRCNTRAPLVPMYSEQRGRRVKELPRFFPMGVCLQADIVNYSAFCSETDVYEVSIVVHSLFALFDRVLQEEPLALRTKTMDDGYQIIMGRTFCQNDMTLDEAVRITRAGALLALRLIKLANRQFAKVGHKELALSCGMSVSPLFLATVGDWKPAFQAFGSAPVIADRLEGLAPRNSLLVSSAANVLLRCSPGFAFSRQIVFHEPIMPIAKSFEIFISLQHITLASSTDYMVSGGHKILPAWVVSRDAHAHGASAAVAFADNLRASLTGAARKRVKVASTSFGLY